MKEMSFNDIMSNNNLKNCFALCEITERNPINNFAEKFSVIKKFYSSQRAYDELEEYKEEGYDVCVIPLFDNADECFKYKFMNNNIIELKHLVTPADMARFFWSYYGMEQ